jgi:hypothetical protein
MTADSPFIGGASDYDRALMLAEALGVRVVETTQEALSDRWGIVSSAVCVHRTARSARGLLGMNDPEPFDLAPGESRIFLSESRHGSALAVLHELGHATLHKGAHYRNMAREDKQRKEVEAWEWALARLARPLTAAERQDITRVLRGYGLSMKEIRTHVLARPA